MYAGQREQSRDGLKRPGGGTRDSNPPGIGDDGIELAERLGCEIQNGRGVAGGSDAFEENGCGLVVGVLGDELAFEGFAITSE